MSSDDRDEFNLKRNPARTYVSPRFDQPDGPERKATKVFDSTRDFAFDVENGRTVLRETPGGREVVEARFFELDRHIKGLTIQKYTASSGRSHRSASVSFWGEQIPRLIEFLLNIKRMHFANSDKVNVADSELRKIILSDQQIGRLAIEDQDALIALARGLITKRDVIALAFRKEQLQRFERLLNDPNFFAKRVAENRGRSKESVWQEFFEENQWIFGCGLTHISLSSLNKRRLQQVVSGTTLASTGKRPDALMKTRGIINALSFIELKHHETALLRREAYRAGAWAPSEELVGGIAQCHATVHAALHEFGERLAVSHYGDPTGEVLFNYDPRSYLVIGRLSEFVTENGVNEQKYRSFEYFRKSVRRPEIITFDELYDRASLIIADDEA